ncbi:hypothetical protein ACFY93_26095 [Streptomyces sp. NPDC008313]|uniref:hypothetical protein n=1 Tax=Streptomyces sp. NPDC008313 TaxID=3364826 RepID=UPI0036EFE395
MCLLTTHRPDGTPHPSASPNDPEPRIAHVISDGASRKVRDVRAAGDLARAA